ncbi:hypothetical protein C8F04DRAFT_949546, partial [Mycena alexandri]
GEMWCFHRSMSRPYFARDRVRHFEIFDRHAEKIITLIKTRLKEGYSGENAQPDVSPMHLNSCRM